ncbi:adenine-specific methyltransferase EcoRI-like protein [Neolewinella xylanilytica]|uniref:Adenine-specific methyltransferase EcoRI-like protein n=1 Tax=Neolewinella xylanilytica TaxID=1514080 RepID=A0A2S6HZM3_9BACT|nr:adenine-specific methyltransferase EcoRI family protein [Neolewinella xylanilytica]PPK83785.1 adenine-specific methyltransferase EcoRI-like protein [Neolewinella xylanilytica]
MARNVQHSLLKEAKANKKDEFYTQLSDIEVELKHYSKHFNNKVVYCNCDDFKVSNFFRYFFENFKALGLKRLIVACYKDQTNNLFASETESRKPYFIEYCGEINGEGVSDMEQIKVEYFKGDGDFRSQESINLLMKSDIVVTNPPFSLFREFIAQLIKFKKKFLVIGNINAITYKEIFKLIKNNKAWMGINMGRGISGFIVPKHYRLYGTETKVDEDGNRIVSPNNCLWLTNMDTSKRHEDICLTKSYYGNESYFPFYDNYNGINVNKTKDIPYDFEGHIGVPITFLHKFNPDQFEIIKFRKGDNGKDLSIDGKCPYFRILVRNKKVRKTKIVHSL